ncbi:ABC transporter ATP-binding protein [Niveispirillum sp.]|uniref:oligopeptide/dipeptide ABC transporter ATP-binding protein n=1 Tax=Niveispirillum sp. TaxID=1917217 RepID=UPI001B6D4DC1|nr:ABC transporter ATP-binding protein [Niveispirillum sp.]MBP7336936.1 ABC transporter ATP-binding protein [Niveispirillum sp.]
MTGLLEINELCVRVPRPGALWQRLGGRNPPPLEILCGVTLDLAAGETLALVGESGSGKTTLARAIMGLQPFCAGSIRFEQAVLTGRGRRRWHRLRRRAAMIFQDAVASLSPRLTVGRLVTEPLSIHGRPMGDRAAEAGRLLSMVGLSPDMAGRYPRELSGGQARRVTVARALAMEPRLVIADEPTAGLDVSVQAEILNLMTGLQRDLGVAYLLITHNLAVVRHVSHRMAVLYLGHLVEVGATAAVTARPRHPYTAALLASEPSIDPARRPAGPALDGEVPSLFDRPPGCAFHTRCRRATDLCRTLQPQFLPVDTGHVVACHHPLD